MHHICKTLTEKMKRLLISIFCLVATCVVASAQLTEQQQIQKLNLVYQQIRSNYVDDVPLEPLVEEAIKATFKELDPHSQYLTREDMASLRARIKGEFAGVGIRYMKHNDSIVVRSIMANSPANKADIKPNDRIIAIDNQNVAGLHTDSVATLLRGDVGSRLSLQIVRRNEPKPISINLQRDYIDNSVISASFRVGNIGYIAISSFSKRVSSDFLDAYYELGDIESLIIDLRDNGGGTLTGAIDLSSLFLKKGEVIVATEGRSSTTTHRKNQDKVSLTIPLVVIINESSASASEIFAGAIQDHDRGVIIGRTSFGKGLIQRVIDLKDGTGLALTVARYKTPSGRVIQRPYEMGDRDAYKQDSLRYMHPDSIPHDHQLLFKTLNSGRKIYGGGGITPDIYIDTDAIALSDCVTKAVAEARFEHLIIDLWDRVSPEDIVEQYPTYGEFSDRYTVDTALLDEFYATTNCMELTQLDEKFILTMLKATMAEQLYGIGARYYIYGIDFDQTLQHAIAIAGDEAIMRSTLM